MKHLGGGLPTDAIATFCNTGLEHEETLRFVERCSVEWDVPVVWLEYDSTKEFKHRVVNFATASRNGEPMADIIEQRKYLPNPVTRFCSVELKIRTIDRYATTLGWSDGHIECVGLRADEMHRVSRLKANNRRNEVFCPMAAAGHGLIDVDRFWQSQSFKLNIPQHLGNCVGCFLKARHKIEAVAREDPSLLEWWVGQEEKARAWGEEGRAKRESFRSDRPTYRQILKQVSEQGLLWDENDYDTIPCNCTD